MLQIESYQNNHLIINKFSTPNKSFIKGLTNFALAG